MAQRNRPEEKNRPEEEEVEELSEEELAEAAVAKAAKKKKLIVLGGIALVLLLVAGGGTWVALKFLGDKDSTEPVAEVSAAEAKPDKSGKPAKPAEAKAHQESFYDALDPAFLANFMTGGRQHYLQVSLAVMARDEASLAALHTHMPLVRNRIVMLLSGEVFDQLQTDEGRVQLQQKLLAAIREIMVKETGKPGIENVFYTNFVMQ